MDDEQMSPRAFDRMMIEVEIGNNAKIARLSDPQFRCLITGVWALAAKAIPRGYLVVADEPATANDVAHQAHCTPAVARKTMELLRSMEMIEMDDELGVEFCHDWWSINPDPKPDPTNAERQRRFKAKREALRNGGGNAIGNAPVTALVTPKVTPPEVKEKEKLTAEAVTALSAAPTSAEIQQVFDAWILSTGRTDKTDFDSNRRALIRDALKKYPLADVLDAVDGWRFSRHHRGENDRHEVYNDLGLILRNSEKIEKFRDYKRKGGAKLVGVPTGRATSGTDYDKAAGL